MWSRSDERETRRVDRAADRNNDADLSAYNDMFARLADRDAKVAGRTAQTTRTAPAEHSAKDSAPKQDPAVQPDNTAGQTERNTKLEGR
jgi:putative copper resistance protein D